MFRAKWEFGAALALLPGLAWAQAGGAAPAGGTQANSGFTLSVTSRIVLEDVTVSDRQGRPVTGLPENSFHVTDDGAPQRIGSFLEQAGETSVAPPEQAGVVSNRTVFGEGTTVAILIDPMSIELQDQMFLRVQVERFLQMVPPGIKVAVFRANNRGVPVLLQSPTTDGVLLRRAMEATVPVIARPQDSAFRNAIAELGNLTDYMRQIPGNKAVLWLAGRFPLYERPDYTLNGGDRAAQEELTRAAMRSMEQARVAVYPIDVRGVQMGGLAPVIVIDRVAAAQDPSSIPKVPPGESAQTSGEYQEMDRLAQATGGTAFYSSNGVAGAMRTAMQLTSASYALSYRPNDYVQDGRWHKVHVTVDGPYTVRYREGYYADTKGEAGHPEGMRVLLAGGAAKVEAAPGTAEAPAAGGYARPLLFGVKIRTREKVGRAERVGVRYVIPTTELQFDSGSGHARFRLAVLAYNAWGDVLGKGIEVVETHYSPDQMHLAERIGTPADMQVDVPNGAQYLLLAVQDLRTDRVGTVQLQLASEGATDTQAQAAPAAPTP